MPEAAVFQHTAACLHLGRSHKKGVVEADVLTMTRCLQSHRSPTLRSLLRDVLQINACVLSSETLTPLVEKR
jgi:hypothetical protein